MIYKELPECKKLGKFNIIKNQVERLSCRELFEWLFYENMIYDHFGSLFIFVAGVFLILSFYFW